MCDVGRVGAAKRRWDRQLQAFHRHEQLTVRMELATALHHSAQRPKSRVVEGPSEGEVNETHKAPQRQNTPHPGTRPEQLAEPPGPQRSDHRAALLSGSSSPRGAVVGKLDTTTDTTLVQWSWDGWVVSHHRHVCWA